MKPPDLSQARVNKCLIALVNRKAVVKDSSSASVSSYCFVVKLIVLYRDKFFTDGRVFASRMYAFTYTQSFIPFDIQSAGLKFLLRSVRSPVFTWHLAFECSTKF